MPIYRAAGALRAVLLPSRKSFVLQHRVMKISMKLHVGRRMRSLYFHLSSDVKAKANATLMLLTAMAARGAAVAQELVRAFDFDQKSIAKLARPPR